MRARDSRFHSNRSVWRKTVRQRNLFRFFVFFVVSSDYSQEIYDDDGKIVANRRTNECVCVTLVERCHFPFVSLSFGFIFGLNRCKTTNHRQEQPNIPLSSLTSQKSFVRCLDSLFFVHEFSVLWFHLTLRTPSMNANVSYFELLITSSISVVGDCINVVLFTCSKL